MSVCSKWVVFIKVDVENLERQLKEREDRENKLKQLALKAKKESAELRNKVCCLALTLQLDQTPAGISSVLMSC